LNLLNLAFQVSQRAFEHLAKACIIRGGELLQDALFGENQAFDLSLASYLVGSQSRASALSLSGSFLLLGLD